MRDTTIVIGALGNPCGPMFWLCMRWL